MKHVFSYVAGEYVLFRTGRVDTIFEAWYGLKTYFRTFVLLIANLWSFVLKLEMRCTRYGQYLYGVYLTKLRSISYRAIEDAERRQGYL